MKSSTFLFMQKRFGITLLLNAVYLFKLSATRYRSTLNNTEAGGLHSTEVEFLLESERRLENVDQTHPSLSPASAR